MIDPLAPKAPAAATEAGFKTAPDAPARERDEALWAQAKAFEAQFLSEMLKLADLGKTPDAFGGGLGEDAFSAMMVDEYAADMVERGSFGLAEQVYTLMAENRT
ncbi:MAG: rod-binding protein [Pseudomonadota bacterium]